MSRSLLLRLTLGFEFFVAHHRGNLSLLWWHRASHADVMELLVSERSSEFIDNCNLEAEIAVWFVGRSVAFVEAIGFLALLLGCACKGVLVKLVHCRWSYLGRGPNSVVHINRIVQFVPFFARFCPWPWASFFLIRSKIMKSLYIWPDFLLVFLFVVFVGSFEFSFGILFPIFTFI